MVFLLTSFQLIEKEVAKNLTAQCVARNSNNGSDTAMDHIMSALDSAVTELEEMREDQILQRQDEEYTYQVFLNHKTLSHTHFNKSKN